MSQKKLSFADLNLSENLLKALADLNIDTPSPIQAQTIPYLLEKKDVVGLAQTGTGKTAAFALPIIQLLNNQREPQALILTPTRELAIQVADHFTSLGAFKKDMQIVVLCGGQPYRPQLQALKDGAQIIVGTPGRILDHLDRGSLKLHALNTLVLDEADEMLRMGFIEDVETILEKLPAKRQLALFSATMPPRIKQIATRFLKNAEHVEIKSETATVKSIKQQFVFASQHEKPETLARILASENHQGVIVFVRTKASADEVADFLQKQNYSAMAIHGDLTQALREKIMNQFKQGTIDILVATDVAARGIDVDRVTHVVNYDIVQDCETYVHRIGRTGRAGRTGISILFVTPRETRMLNMIERHTRQKIEKIRVPDDNVINLAKQSRFLARITDRLEHPNLNSYRELLENYLKENTLDSLDLAAALALLMHKDKPLNYENFFPKTLKKKNEKITNKEKRNKNNIVSRKKKFSNFSKGRFAIDNALPRR